MYFTFFSLILKKDQNLKPKKHFTRDLENLEEKIERLNPSEKKEELWESLTTDQREYLEQIEKERQKPEEFGYESLEGEFKDPLKNLREEYEDRVEEHYENYQNQNDSHPKSEIDKSKDEFVNESNSILF